MSTPTPTPSTGGGVHFVLAWEAASIGVHRPAVILDVVDPTAQTLHLQIFTSANDGDRYSSGHYEMAAAVHDEDTKAPGTWHWPE